MKSSSDWPGLLPGRGSSGTRRKDAMAMNHDAADPHASDEAPLPPGVGLPDAATYRRGQLQAQLVVILTGLVILALGWLMTEAGSHHRLIFAGCTLAVGTVLAITAWRYVKVCRQARPRPPQALNVPDK